MKIYTYKGKVYNYEVLTKKVLPKLLTLLDYIQDSNQDYFSKEELIKIYENKGVKENYENIWN